MLNFMFLTAFTGWPATVTLVFLTVSIVFSPCIFVSLQDYWANLRQRAEEQHDIINTVVRTHWDPEVFKALDDCAICTNTFGKEDQVTPLPCDTKHYFHTECIVRWFQTQDQKTSCPICRKQFTREEMRAYSQDVEKRLASKERDE